MYLPRDWVGREAQVPGLPSRQSAMPPSHQLPPTMQPLGPMKNEAELKIYVNASVNADGLPATAIIASQSKKRGGRRMTTRREQAPRFVKLRDGDDGSLLQPKR